MVAGIGGRRRLSRPSPDLDTQLSSCRVLSEFLFPQQRWGSGMFILDPDPNIFHSGSENFVSRILIISQKDNFNTLHGRLRCYDFFPYSTSIEQSIKIPSLSLHIVQSLYFLTLMYR
jgi:hypothetical protein